MRNIGCLNIVISVLGVKNNRFLLLSNPETEDNCILRTKLCLLQFGCTQALAHDILL